MHSFRSSEGTRYRSTLDRKVMSSKRRKEEKTYSLLMKSYKYLNMCRINGTIWCRIRPLFASETFHCVLQIDPTGLD